MTEGGDRSFASARAEDIWIRLAAKHGIDVEGKDPSVLRALVVREVLGDLPVHRSGEPGGC
jgi:uncharacterized membrane protein (DUF441 family)